MLARFAVFALLTFTYAQQGTAATAPPELQFIKESVGVWDAVFEVWPTGPDSPSMKFKGVETNRAFGKHWIASDLESTMNGKTIKVHSIVGYDLDRKQLVGTVIDEGPYSASLSGEYDVKSKTVHWTTKAKGPDGTPMVQRTTLTHRSADERVLVLKVPGNEPEQFVKFMEIRFTRRK